MPLLLNIALSVLGASAAVQPAPSLQVLFDTPVPAHMRWTQDVRWASANEMFLTAGRAGVYRFPLRKPLPNGEIVIPGDCGVAPGRTGRTNSSSLLRRSRHSGGESSASGNRRAWMPHTHLRRSSTSMRMATRSSSSAPIAIKKGTGHPRVPLPGVARFATA